MKLTRRHAVLALAAAMLAALAGLWAWLRGRAPKPVAPKAAPPAPPAPPPPPPVAEAKEAKIEAKPEAAPETDETKTVAQARGPRCRRAGLPSDPLADEPLEAAIARGKDLAWRKPALRDAVTADKWLAVRPLDLPGLSGLIGSTIEVSDAVLRRVLGERVPAPGPIVFAVRSARPPAASTGMAEVQRLTVSRVDHHNLHCTVGVWDPDARTVSAHAASTVPNRTAVVAAGLGVQNANMLAPGVHAYVPGPHSNYKAIGCPFSIKGALRQNGPSGGAGAAPAWRPTHPGGFSDARLDTARDDNVHCAETPYLEPWDRFSSEGCVVVAGRYTPDEGHVGPWARFREQAAWGGRSAVTFILVDAPGLASA